MKINFTCLLAGILPLLTLSTNGQSILPSTSTASCPGSTVSFTVTLPTGAYYGAQAYGWPIVGVSGCQAASINSGTAPLNHNVLTFSGSFIDWDGPQGMQLTCYDASGTLRTFDFHYDRIESFNTPDVASEPVPSPATVTAPRCQTAAFNISFPKVVYADPWTATKLTYGTVTTYEYLLPVGWSIGSSVSDGSTWIPGSSAVTVNADAADGIAYRSISELSGYRRLW
ncbi:MAG TPA: hypothetical protein VGM30_15645 [Puia sp.]